MKRSTRVQVYEGLYRSQADELFQADAAEAARHGWRAVDEGRWNGEQLAVTYVHEPGWKGGLRRTPEPPKPTSSTPSQPSRSRGRRLASAFVHTTVLLVLIVAVVVAIIGVALIADVGNIREMAEDLPKPFPRLVKDYLEWVKSMRG